MAYPAARDVPEGRRRSGLRSVYRSGSPFPRAGTEPMRTRHSPSSL